MDVDKEEEDVRGKEVEEEGKAFEEEEEEGMEVDDESNEDYIAAYKIAIEELKRLEAASKKTVRK